jgi:hypothetical protein
MDLDPQIKINPASSESGVFIISSWQHPARVGWLSYQPTAIQISNRCLIIRKWLK